VYTAGITPEATLVFKAIVVIAVCLPKRPSSANCFDDAGATPS